MSKPRTVVVKKRSFKINKAAAPAQTLDRHGPCDKATDRKGCPVQLVFKDDRGYVRLCSKSRQAAPLIAAGSAKDARRIAKEACECWRANGRKFTQACYGESTGLGDLAALRRLGAKIKALRGGRR